MGEVKWDFENAKPFPIEDISQKVREYIDREIAASFALPQSALESNTYTIPPEKLEWPTERDPLADLEAAYNMIMSLPPVAVAIWVVDRPDVVGHIRWMIDEAFTSSLFKLPLYEVTMEYIESHRFGSEIMTFITEPGVYAEMNKGEHKRLNI